MKPLIFLIFFIFLGFFSGTSQNLSQYQWKNRIILLIANSFENDSLRKQKELLSEFPEKLKERKLIQYEISPSYYRLETDMDHTELGTATTFKKYNPTKAPFKLILIGLDGGIKLEKDSPTDPTSLFDLIDQMPMRKNELKSN